MARSFRLDHVTDYLAASGRPDARATVHIAGSKGKGSTAAMVESVLRAAGARTLTLTSPDVHTARERVRVAGRPLEPALFSERATELLADPASGAWSYFECLTVLGWLAAARAGCDWQVVEVGLGGRLDTTNALATKHVAAILPIDLEHTAILGETIREIAAEKAGILTGPCACVVAPMRETAARVVAERAREVSADLHVVAEECRARVTQQSLDGQLLDLMTPVRTYRRLRLPLIGRHQSENAATAVRAAELAWEREYSSELPERAVREGLAGVELPVRLEPVRRRPLVLLDGMHTPLAARRVA
ncbi:MAG: bifunctional folylpolyglutamate synthase/dihydrofolate synthase, partial [Chloroflexi bacterium]|nr:bifunctional folylpolyglutamate synthase/dihydrofolate synthase [Chloroflexota bacterium]